MISDFYQGDTKTITLTVTEAPKPIKGITAANPAVVTVYQHGYSTGNIVYLRNAPDKTLLGMEQLGADTTVGKYYTITVVDANTFSLDSTDTSTYNAYQSGGEAAKATGLYGSVIRSTLKRRRSQTDATAALTQTDTPPDDAVSSRGEITITWSSTSTAIEPGPYHVGIQKTETGSPPTVTTLLTGTVNVLSDVTDTDS